MDSFPANETAGDHTTLHVKGVLETVYGEFPPVTPPVSLFMPL